MTADQRRAGMWRCARCGTRNSRNDDHCAQCGMASPFRDSHETKTIDVPGPATERERSAAPSRSWLPIVVGVGAVVIVALFVVMVLTG